MCTGKESSDALREFYRRTVYHTSIEILVGQIVLDPIGYHKDFFREPIRHVEQQQVIYILVSYQRMVTRRKVSFTVIAVFLPRLPSPVPSQHLYMVSLLVYATQARIFLSTLI